MVLDFKDIQSKKVVKYSNKMPEFVNATDPKLYINFMSPDNDWINILVKINGINKFFATYETEDSNVSPIFIKPFSLKIFF